MRRKIEEDQAYAIVNRIMSTPVPLQSELSNPFNSNKRKKKIVLNPEDKKDNTLSNDVTLWTAKSFVDYFADCHSLAFESVGTRCAAINDGFDQITANGSSLAPMVFCVAGLWVFWCGVHWLHDLCGGLVA